MGRRKSNSAGVFGLLALIVVGIVIQYWKFIFTAGAGIAAFYVILKVAKYYSDKKAQDLNSQKYNAAGGLSTNGVQVTFSFGPNPKVDRASDAGVKFMSGNAPLAIGQLKFPAHLLYVGRTKNEYPHLVDTSLKIGEASPGFSASMGYYPSYSSISPQDRATFLAWLADGRSNPTADIGLVFLYFYGLEFRAIEEKKNQSEVFAELVRLFKIYSGNRSFSGYCSKFITLLVLENPSWGSSELSDLCQALKADPSLSHLFSPIIFKVAEHLLPGEQAFLAYCATSRQAFHTSAYRNIGRPLVESFEQAVSSYQFDKTKLEKESTVFEYNSASALRLSSREKVQQETLSQKQNDELGAIWTEKVREFSKHSKLKESKSELANLFAHAAKDKEESSMVQKRLTEFFSFEGAKIFTVLDLTRELGSKEAHDLSASQARTLSDGLENFGISIEPDARFINKGLKSEDKVILIKQDLSDTDPKRWSPAVNLFDLAFSVTQADHSVDEKELKFTTEFIVHQFKLNQVEEIRLSFRAKLLSESKVAVSAIAKKLASTMTVKQGQSVAKFLFSVAALDGKLAPAESAALTKAYKAFGFSPDTLDRLIAEFSSSNNGELVVLKAKEGKRSKKGSAIPSTPEVAASQPIVLNQEALKNAFNEAGAVAEFLGTIFEDGSTASAKETLVATKTSPSGLNPSENQILSLLSTKEKWIVSEVEELCRKSGVMYGAFLTRVNDHFAIADGPSVLSEDGDELFVLLDRIGSEVKSA